MKWPNSLIFIRHGESEYNILKKWKAESSEYQKFKEIFEKEYAEPKPGIWPSRELTELAKKVWVNTRLPFGDYNTPLTEEGIKQAKKTGEKLEESIETPDYIYVSPYLRTRQTLEFLMETCPKLRKVEIIHEERIREQEHGMATIYNDWRIYDVLHPEQAFLYKLEGDYEYRFLNGENKSDVRDRVRSFLGTLIREHAEDKILVVSHHLTLLCLRANLERWDRERFIETDQTEKPINCGVTIYKGDPNQGKNGKLVLDKYNLKLY